MQVLTVDREKLMDYHAQVDALEHVRKVCC